MNFIHKMNVLFFLLTMNKCIIVIYLSGAMIPINDEATQ